MNLSYTYLIITMESIQRRQTFESLNFATKQRRPQLNNAYVKWHSIPINIKRYFTDVDGAVIAKAAAPAALQTYYPFFMFGEFDREGGYNTALKALGVAPGTFYLTSFMNANGITAQQITGFTGLNTVRNFIKNGDIVHVFTDNLNAPNFFVWVVVSNQYGAMSSIVGNSESHQKDGLIGKIYLDFFKYYTDNPNEQFKTPLHFTRSTNIATWSDNQVQPYIFKTPYTEQQGFVDIQCQFNLDQYLSVGSFFQYTTESINMLFRLGTLK